MKKLSIDTHSTGFAISVLLLILIAAIVFFSIRSANLSLYDEGMAKYDASDYRGAIADFRADVGYRPDHSLGHYYLACSLLKVQQRSEARAEFDKAYQAELRSGNPDTAFAAKCLSKAKGLNTHS